MRNASSLHVRMVFPPCTYRLAALRMRTITSTTSGYTPTRKPKEEGTIADVFSSLTGSDPALPTRFANLKKNIWREALTQSWREVLNELDGAIEEIVARGPDVLEFNLHVCRRLHLTYFLDNTFRTIPRFAERTIDKSNLGNPESWCPDCPRRRTKRGRIHLM